MDWIRDASGNFANYIVRARDVTKETQLEEQLRTSQKMEALGLLASGIAHDFNNLLHVVQGNAGLALHDPHLSPSVRESLAQINTAVERAAQLTRQLLVFGRGEPNERTQFDLNHTTREMIKMLARLIGPHVVVDFHPSSLPAEIVGDRGQIEQVLLNLCLNARDAMPTGGHLRISLQHSSPSSPHAPHEVVLTVSDTGSGMEPATISRIYEPFFTTKPQGRGTGLGLSVVYSVVRKHEGVIDVQSAPGKGTVFTIRFPAANTLPAHAASEEAPPLPAPRGTETVLVSPMTTAPSANSAGSPSPAPAIK